MFLQFIENTIKVFTIEQGNDFSLTRAPGVRQLADTFHLDARVHKKAIRCRTAFLRFLIWISPYIFTEQATAREPGPIWQAMLKERGSV